MAVIDTLRQDHENITELLNALEKQIDALDKRDQPDYDVIRGIADYFFEVPQYCHHLKENILLRRLREMRPQDAAEIGDLEGEHLEMAERAGRFHKAVAMLLSESDAARDAVANAARVFIETERQHIKKEEEQFFPLAEQSLEPEDWSDIASQCESMIDPLFADEAEMELQELGERLLAWQKEYRSG